MQIPEFDEIIEPNDQTEARREHLEKLRELVGNVYPNKFDRSNISGGEDTITRILNFALVAGIAAEIKTVLAALDEGQRPPAEVKDALNARLKELGNVRISGRLAVPPRVMGKAAFVHLSDGMSRLQVYVRRDDVKGVYNGSVPPANAPPAIAGGTDTVNGWEIFQLLDHGDFIGVEGYLFITNTGELSVHVEKLQFLAKAMLPMPDKMHGIADPEIRQRQRYADLIASSLQIEHEGLTTREVFETRAKVISSLRRFLEDRGYIEVETPMLTPKATGATAKPFETHHNALDITLYARIAPELYLKRLLVGGFEKVYELNRNFRNEGISYKHNPEFTMLEFYCAYMDVNGMMNFCEEMMKDAVRKGTGGSQVRYEGNEINFQVPFSRVSMKRSIVEFLPMRIKSVVGDGFSEVWLDDPRNRRALLRMCRWFESIPKQIYEVEFEKDGEVIREFATLSEDDILLIEKKKREGTAINYRPVHTEQQPASIVQNNWNTFHSEAHSSNPHITEAENIQLMVDIFEASIESRLIQPTFIVDYPKSISPLSKASPDNPQIAERFELFINGMEIANGFSELNDPKEQYERFIDQMSERERGDEEAMVLDEDYIRALSYGMPPAAGIGIGIDRLVMLLTNKHSIRDVILFPHLRPEQGREGES